MLLRFILTKIEYFYSENRYTLILLFKHLRPKSTHYKGGKFPGVKYDNSSIAFFMFYILNVIVFSM